MRSFIEKGYSVEVGENGSWVVHPEPKHPDFGACRPYGFTSAKDMLAFLASEHGIEAEVEDAIVETLQEAAHLSDCAVHNEPAMEAGPCDCGDDDVFEQSDLPTVDDVKGVLEPRVIGSYDTDEEALLEHETSVATSTAPDTYETTANSNGHRILKNGEPFLTFGRSEYDAYLAHCKALCLAPKAPIGVYPST